MQPALPHEYFVDGRISSGLGGRFYGVYPALVSDIKDPDGLGRIKVTLPWSPDTGSARYEAWARIATLMGGPKKGSWFIPDVDDEVLIVFEAGDTRRPYVVGGLWNGTDEPPATMDGGGQNYEKVLCSRNGVKITLDDHDGQEKFIVETPGSQKITLQDGPGSVKIEDSNGNSIKLESSGVTVTASAKVNVQASQVSISAGMVQVDAGMSKFSGVIQCDTLISNSVVSSSYTPGAGNIW
ncbi:MAG TPA: phage baseplate assembly protein V [Lacunisphaera sp.]|nr:phage baseplate assembly protein V [Lacunisphaera sp.]